MYTTHSLRAATATAQARSHLRDEHPVVYNPEAAEFVSASNGAASRAAPTEGSGWSCASELRRRVAVSGQCGIRAWGAQVDGLAEFFMVPHRVAADALLRARTVEGASKMIVDEYWRTPWFTLRISEPLIVPYVCGSATDAR
jgi:hypothetical protein